MQQNTPTSRNSSSEKAGNREKKQSAEMNQSGNLEPGGSAEQNYNFELEPNGEVIKNDQALGDSAFESEQHTDLESNHNQILLSQDNQEKSKEPETTITMTEEKQVLQMQHQVIELENEHTEEMGVENQKNRNQEPVRFEVPVVIEPEVKQVEKGKIEEKKKRIAQKKQQGQKVTISKVSSAKTKIITSKKPQTSSRQSTPSAGSKNKIFDQEEEPVENTIEPKVEIQVDNMQKLVTSVG